MKLFTHSMKSRKWRGLQIAVVRFDDGAQLLLTPKPESGERIEAKVRPIAKRCAQHKAKIGGDA